MSPSNYETTAPMTPEMKAVLDKIGPYMRERCPEDCAFVKGHDGEHVSVTESLMRGSRLLICDAVPPNPLWHRCIGSRGHAGDHMTDRDHAGKSAYWAQTVSDDAGGSRG